MLSADETKAMVIKVNLFNEMLDALRRIEGMCNMPEVRQAMMKHNQAYYHTTMNEVRKAISKGEGQS